MTTHKYITEARKHLPEISWEYVKKLNGMTLVISELLPMESNAGWYLGRHCLPVNDGIVEQFPEPLTRETSYYKSAKDIEEALKNKDLIVRDCNENNWLYDNNIIPLPNF